MIDGDNGTEKHGNVCQAFLRIDNVYHVCWRWDVM